MTPSLELPPGLSLREVVGWDSGTWSRAIAFWLEESRVRLAGARVLEVGAGEGGLSLYLAALGAHVVCTDWALQAQVRPFHDRYVVTGRIEYRTLDLTRWPGDLGTFDVIVEKSVVGGLGAPDLDTQRRAIASMIGALNPAGEYWFADNLRGSPLMRMLRPIFLRRHRLWHYYDGIDELKELFPPKVEMHIVRLGLIGALGRTENQREALTRIEGWLGLEKLLPERWRYVAAGIARNPDLAGPAPDRTLA